MSAGSQKRTGAISRIGDFVVGVFTRNLLAKSFALVLAVVVWVTVGRGLTSTFSDPRTEVGVNLAPGLMLLDDRPSPRRVEFRGPTSAINLLRKDEPREIRLSVAREDLGDQPETTIAFSVDRRNILHGYGEDVEITQVDRSPIILRVAVRETKTVKVRVPELSISAPQWEGKTNQITLEVAIQGPSSRLKGLTEVTTEPIPADRLLQGHENEESFERTLELKLASDTERKLVELAPGQRIWCGVDFSRSRVPREIAIPCHVYTPRAEWPVVVELSDALPLEKRDGGFFIKLTFVGLPRNLDAVETAVEGRSIRAYVRAEDTPEYDKKPDELEEGTYYIARVFVEGLPPGVSYYQPSEPVEVNVRKRKE